MLAVFFLTLAADQAAKLALSSVLAPSESIPAAGGILRITLVHNPGALFGILPGANALIISASFVFLAVISVIRLRMPAPERSVDYSLGLIAGGAAGNLLDRLRLGYVIDFLDLGFWPVFNIADIALTAGAVIIIWKMSRQRTKKSC